MSSDRPGLTLNGTRPGLFFSLYAAKKNADAYYNQQLGNIWSWEMPNTKQAEVANIKLGSADMREEGNGNESSVVVTLLKALLLSSASPSKSQ